MARVLEYVSSVIIFLDAVLSIHLVANLPNTIRHNVEEFVEVTAHGNIHTQTIDVAVTVRHEIADAKIFFHSEAHHTIEESLYLIHVPLRINPSYKDCCSASVEKLCRVIVTMVVKDGGGRFWNQSSIANVVRTPSKVYIQTDKSQYFPGENVYIRFIALTHDFVLTKRKVRLRIEYPGNDDMMVLWKRKTLLQKKPFIKVFRLPDLDFAIGTWRISASFLSKTMSRARFRKTFEVNYNRVTSFRVSFEHEGRDFIFPDDTKFMTRVIARTFRGEPITGSADVTFGIIRTGSNDSPEITHFMTNLQLTRGHYFLNVSVNHLTDGRLPSELEGMSLAIIASVVEYGSGDSESADSTVMFTDKPYTITFIDQAKRNFIPGQTIINNARVTYANGSLAEGIQIYLGIAYIDAGGFREVFHQINTTTCDLGTALTYAESPLNSQQIVVMVSAAYVDPSGSTYNVSNEKVMDAELDSGKEYITIIPPQGLLQPGSTYVVQIYGKPSREENEVYYYLSKDGSKFQHGVASIDSGRTDALIELTITPNMSPSVLLVVYYMSAEVNELTLGHTTLFVENVCEAPVIISNMQDGNVLRPGQQVEFDLYGEPRSVISVVANDAAANSAEERKLGGEITADLHGGERAKQLLCDRNFVGSHTQGSVMTCSDTVRPVRQRRSVQQNYRLTTQENSSIRQQECCLAGSHDTSTVYRNLTSCSERLNTLHVSASCKRAFLSCCNLAECFRRYGKYSRLCRTINNYVDRSVSTSLTLEMIGTVILEKNLQIRRKDFRSTWFFADFDLRKSTQTHLSEFSDPMIPLLPDKITTWNVELFSTSTSNPVCIGNSISMSVNQSVYADLRISKSPITVGSMSTAEVVIYNYVLRRLKIVMYVDADDGICVGENFGKSFHVLESGRIQVPSTVKILLSFIPIVPGSLNLKIKIVWQNYDGGVENVDEVVQRVKVIPHGIPARESIWILEDTRGEDVPLTRKEIFKISDEAIPGTVEITASVLPFIQALLTGPDTSNMPSTTIQYHIYKLQPKLIKMEYFAYSNQSSSNQGLSIEQVEDDFYDLLGFSAKIPRLRKVKETGGDRIRKFAFSYSSGRNSLPSLRLTSSVVALLCRLLATFDIDPTLLRGSILWILDHQNSRGYYQEALEGEDADKIAKHMSKKYSKIYLTSVIAMNLYTAMKNMAEVEKKSRPLSSTVMRSLESSIKKAAAYISNKAEQIAPASTCHGSAALSASALALQLIERFPRSGIVESLERWKLGHSSHTGDVWWIKACIDVGATHYNLEKSLTEEATAHALRLGVMRGNVSYGYANWLMQSRNSDDYWSSVYATLSALDSLYQYALMEAKSDSTGTIKEWRARRQYALKVGANFSVNYTAPGRGRAWIKINSSYYSSQKSRSYTVKSRTIRSTSSTSCIYNMSITISEYNTPFPESRSSSRRRFAWKISVEIERIHGQEDYKAYVIDISLPVGSKVIEDDLQKLFNPVEQILDRYRLTSRSVILYMTGEKYVSFRITDPISKGDPLPATVYPVDNIDMSCVVYFNFPGYPTIIQTFCATEHNLVDPVCVCVNRKSCPTARKPKTASKVSVDKRISKACDQKTTFAYKIYVKRVEFVDFAWLNYVADVQVIFRSNLTVVDGTESSFWVRRICSKIPIKRSYMVIGNSAIPKADGTYKHLLDGGGWLELWPKKPANCDERNLSSACKSVRKLEEYEYKMGISSCGFS